MSSPTVSSTNDLSIVKEFGLDMPPTPERTKLTNYMSRKLEKVNKAKIDKNLRTVSTTLEECLSNNKENLSSCNYLLRKLEKFDNATNGESSKDVQLFKGIILLQKTLTEMSISLTECEIAKKGK